MKNSTNLNLITLLFIILSIPSFAQFEEMKVDTNQNVVISPNGLSIRIKPSLKSKKLGAVPFGEKVKIDDDKSHGWDTIGNYKYFYGEEDSYTSPITGHWVKVKYQNIQGFMFNAYLYYYAPYSSYDSVIKKKLNKDFALLFPGENCFTNINFAPNMNWYGLYFEKGKYSLRKTTISFYRVFSDMLDFGISSNDNKNLLFILGSKKPLKQKTIKDSFWRGHNQSLYPFKDEYHEEFKKHGIEFQQKEGESLSIILKDKSKSQLLNPKELQISYPSGILWKGDLDGDGKPDYIFHFGEKSGQTILYLSSEANGEEIVKPVAAYFSGYCC
ncbi:MAG: SH3 domain-containing protein [Saprospiraceae bacterium]